jgi:hypothetical protein
MLGVVELGPVAVIVKVLYRNVVESPARLQELPSRYVRRFVLASRVKRFEVENG